MLISLIFRGLCFCVFFILGIKSIKKYKENKKSEREWFWADWSVKNLKRGG